MGRPKRYPTRAAQQAAYRQRRDAELVTVNRAALTNWEDRLTRLLTAITQAARVGDPLASHLLRTHDADTLDHLIAWFAQRGKENAITLPS